MTRRADPTSVPADARPLPPRTIAPGPQTSQASASAGATRSLREAVRPPYLYDPRPDLAADSRVWQALLELAFLLDGEAPDGLFGALHGVRCCGARLVPRGEDRRPGAGYRMGPGDAYLGGAAAWAADRARWLAPSADVLTPVLRGLRAVGGARATTGDASTSEPQEDGSDDPRERRGDRS